jgi:putrescine transport system substrate-binding protein
MSLRRAAAGWAGLSCALILLLSACGRSPGHGAVGTASGPKRNSHEEQVVNVYNWYDYIKPELLRKFEAEYGIKVHYDVFDSNSTLEAKLLAAHSGYDVAFPSGAYLERLLAAGVFRPLDPAQLPNLANMDPAIMQRLATHDPDNAHAIAYTWGITGFAYDAAKVRARLPKAPTDSWAMLFDPQVAAHFADCGIGLYESPEVIVPSVLAWLGEPPNSEDESSLKRAQATLMAVRPYIRKISSGSLVDDLATGQLCLIIASNGDAMQAQERARIASNGEDIRYSIPREGAVMWVDAAAILADAPHPGNAHLFLNFLMDPSVAAENTNAIHFPNGNAASQGLVRKELTNAAIFPDPQIASRLIPQRAKSEEYVRMRTRMWTRFRTGR